MKAPPLPVLAWWSLVGLLFLLMLVMMALGGCVSEPVQATILTDVKTERIEVPVPVACAVNVPERPVTAMPPPGADIARKAAGASADVRELNRHIDKLEAVLKACEPQVPNP